LIQRRTVYTETWSRRETSFGVRKGCMGESVGVTDMPDSVGIERPVLTGTIII